jgi:hypothetical protein
MYLHYSTLGARMLSFLSWTALSNQNADDLSAGGFFYTGELIYKFIICLLQNQTFSLEPLIYKFVFYR